MAIRPEECLDPAAAFVARCVKRKGVRSILLAGARSGAGTTVTTLGIARRLGEVYGMRCLAVELDLWSPGFARLLGLEDGPGLAALGAGGSAAACVRPVAPGLDVLAMAPGEKREAVGSDPATLLGRCLEEAVDGHDVVLVDAPPLLERADAIAAAALVDGVLVVVEAGRSRFEVLEHVRTLLDLEEIALLGAVLTKQRYAIPGWVYRLLLQ